MRLRAREPRRADHAGRRIAGGATGKNEKNAETNTDREPCPTKSPSIFQDFAASKRNVPKKQDFCFLRPCATMRAPRRLRDTSGRSTIPRDDKENRPMPAEWQ